MWRAVPQFGAELVHGLQQTQAVLDEDAPGGSRHQSARMTFKQRVAQRILQFADAPAGLCQRQVRAPRRRRQADRYEVKPGQVVAHG